MSWRRQMRQDEVDRLDLWDDVSRVRKFLAKHNGDLEQFAIHIFQLFRGDPESLSQWFTKKFGETLTIRLPVDYGYDKKSILGDFPGTRKANEVYLDSFLEDHDLCRLGNASEILSHYNDDVHRLQEDIFILSGKTINVMRRYTNDELDDFFSYDASKVNKRYDKFARRDVPRLPYSFDTFSFDWRVTVQRSNKKRLYDHLRQHYPRDKHLSFIYLKRYENDIPALERFIKQKSKVDIHLYRSTEEFTDADNDESSIFSYDTNDGNGSEFEDDDLSVDTSKCYQRLFEKRDVSMEDKTGCPSSDHQQEVGESIDHIEKIQVHDRDSDEPMKDVIRTRVLSKESGEQTKTNKYGTEVEDQDTDEPMKEVISTDDSMKEVSGPVTEESGDQTKTNKDDDSDVPMEASRTDILEIEESSRQDIDNDSDVLMEASRTDVQDKNQDSEGRMKDVVQTAVSDANNEESEELSKKDEERASEGVMKGVILTPSQTGKADASVEFASDGIILTPSQTGKADASVGLASGVTMEKVKDAEGDGQSLSQSVSVGQTSPLASTKGRLSRRGKRGKSRKPKGLSNSDGPTNAIDSKNANKIKVAQLSKNSMMRGLLLDMTQVITDDVMRTGIIEQELVHSTADGVSLLETLSGKDAKSAGTANTAPETESLSGKDIQSVSVSASDKAKSPKERVTDTTEEDKELKKLAIEEDMELEKLVSNANANESVRPVSETIEEDMEFNKSALSEYLRTHAKNTTLDVDGLMSQYKDNLDRLSLFLEHNFGHYCFFRGPHNRNVNVVLLGRFFKEKLGAEHHEAMKHFIDQYDDSCADIIDDYSEDLGRLEFRLYLEFGKTIRFFRNTGKYDPGPRRIPQYFYIGRSNKLALDKYLQIVDPDKMIHSAGVIENYHDNVEYVEQELLKEYKRRIVLLRETPATSDIVAKNDVPQNDQELDRKGGDVDDEDSDQTEDDGLSNSEDDDEAETEDDNDNDVQMLESNSPDETTEKTKQNITQASVVDRDEKESRSSRKSQDFEDDNDNDVQVLESNSPDEKTMQKKTQASVVDRDEKESRRSRSRKSQLKRQKISPNTKSVTKGKTNRLTQLQKKEQDDKLKRTKAALKKMNREREKRKNKEFLNAPMDEYMSLSEKSDYSDSDYEPGGTSTETDMEKLMGRFLRKVKKDTSKLVENQLFGGHEDSFQTNFEAKLKEDEKTDVQGESMSTREKLKREYMIKIRALEKEMQADTNSMEECVKEMIRTEAIHAKNVPIDLDEQRQRIRESEHAMQRALQVCLSRFEVNDPKYDDIRDEVEIALVDTVRAIKYDRARSKPADRIFNFIVFWRGKEQPEYKVCYEYLAWIFGKELMDVALMWGLWEIRMGRDPKLFDMPAGASNSDVAPEFCLMKLDPFTETLSPKIKFIQGDRQLCFGYSFASALEYVGYVEEADAAASLANEWSRMSQKLQFNALSDFANTKRIRLRNHRKSFSFRGLSGSELLKKLALADRGEDRILTVIVPLSKNTVKHAIHAFVYVQGMIFDSTQEYPLLPTEQTLDFVCGDGGFRCVHMSKSFLLTKL